MRLAWSGRDDDSATFFVRWTGWAIVLVSVTVALSLVVRSVDLNPFIVATVGFGLASGLLAARTGRAFFPFLLLVLAAFPTIFGWYVFFYLPLLLLLAVGGAARTIRRAPPEPSS
ncbi:MAG TPA: hypothetical protein VJ979_08165 [Actinomycetota bacterium]|nr:hypothetical protein [Actinomycetota bacterium]